MSHEVDPLILEKLAAFSRRRLRLILFRGLAATLATLLATIFCSMQPSLPSKRRSQSAMSAKLSWLSLMQGCSKRDGRAMIYAARFETMNNLLGYLTENCCGGRADRCLSKRRAVERTRRHARAP